MIECGCAQDTFHFMVAILHLWPGRATDLHWFIELTFSVGNTNSIINSFMTMLFFLNHNYLPDVAQYL